MTNKLAAVNPRSPMNDERYQQPTGWVENITATVCMPALGDPQLLSEVYPALMNWTQILGSGFGLATSSAADRMEKQSMIYPVQPSRWPFPGGDGRQAG